MSTNRVLIGRIRGIAANYEAEDATGDIFEEIADALEAAETKAEFRRKTAVANARRAKAAEATLAKVLTYAQSRVGATKREILAILDADAPAAEPIEWFPKGEEPIVPRPAPTESGEREDYPDAEGLATLRGRAAVSTVDAAIEHLNGNRHADG